MTTEAHSGANFNFPNRQAPASNILHRYSIPVQCPNSTASSRSPDQTASAPAKAHWLLTTAKIIWITRPSSAWEATFPSSKSTAGRQFHNKQPSSFPELTMKGRIVTLIALLSVGQALTSDLQAQAQLPQQTTVKPAKKNVFTRMTGATRRVLRDNRVKSLFSKLGKKKPAATGTAPATTTAPAQ